jgi:hypothetical protein
MAHCLVKHKDNFALPFNYEDYCRQGCDAFSLLRRNCRFHLQGVFSHENGSENQTPDGQIHTARSHRCEQ